MQRRMHWACFGFRDELQLECCLFAVQANVGGGADEDGEVSMLDGQTTPGILRRPQSLCHSRPTFRLEVNFWGNRFFVMKKRSLPSRMLNSSFMGLFMLFRMTEGSS